MNVALALFKAKANYIRPRPGVTRPRPRPRPGVTRPRPRPRPGVIRPRPRPRPLPHGLKARARPRPRPRPNITGLCATEISKKRLISVLFKSEI